MLCSSRNRLVRNHDWIRVGLIRVDGQRPPLDLAYAPILRLKLVCNRHDLGLFLRLLSRVVVCQLDPDLASVFPFAVQTLPQIVLPTTRHHDVVQSHPGFADEVGALVLAENGDLEGVVIGGVVDSEPQFLVPVILLSAKNAFA